MAKRIAGTELNHDNWNDEEDVEEAGSYNVADDKTLKERVIKKAKRRVTAKNPEGGSSIFAGFGGFAKSSTGNGSFDFLAKKTSPPAKNGEAAAKFDFSSPPTTSSAPTFAFGAKPTTGNNGNSAEAEVKKPAGLFAFGSAVAKTSSTFAFGSSSAANDAKSSASFSFGKKDSNPSPKPEEPPKTISNPIVMPKTNKWSCSVCMVANDPDKDKCVCCSEPKPGSKPPADAKSPAAGFKFGASGVTFGMNPGSKPADSGSSSGFKFGMDPGSKPADSGSSSGFKFGSSGPASQQPPASGFTFGLNKPAESETGSAGFGFGSTGGATAPSPVTFGLAKSDSTGPAESGASTCRPTAGSPQAGAKTSPAKHQDAGKQHSKAFLAHLKALNTQVVSWIKTHVDKNPYVFLSPVFKDYERHLKEVTDNHGGGSNSSSEDKPRFGSGIAFGDSKPVTADKPLLAAVFGASKKEEAEDKPAEATTGFAFGKPPAGGAVAKPDGEKAAGFSFGAPAGDKPAMAGFTFGSDKAPAGSSSSGFTFGSSGSGDKPTAGFSFGLSAANHAPAFASASDSKPAEDDKDDEDDEDSPPKVEVTTVVEDDSFYSVRCKLFYKKDKEFVEKGLGMLHLKKAADSKTQLVVRAETNLGNILLNILLSGKMSMVKRKNNLQFVCVPNPPIPGLPEGPASMLLKVKDASIADQLEAKMKEASAEN